MNKQKKSEEDKYPQDWIESKLDLMKPQISRILNNSTKSSEKLAEIIIDLIKFDLRNTYDALKDYQKASIEMKKWMETMFDKCKYHFQLGDFCLHPSNDPEDVQVGSLKLKKSKGVCYYYDCPIRKEMLKNENKMVEREV